MSTEQRRHFSVPEKVGILRKHFLEKVALSDLCDQHGISPATFYNWQKILFENAAAAFDRSGKRAPSAQDELNRKVAGLEAKLQRKDFVLAELMEEHTLLKKTLGEP